MSRTPFELRLGAHCTERPEVNQDKPELTAPLARRPEPLHIETPNARSARANPAAVPVLLGAVNPKADGTGLSPLYDVKRPTALAEPSGNLFFLKHG
jgi:hypothetical protein